MVFSSSLSSLAFLCWADGTLPIMGCDTLHSTGVISPNICPAASVTAPMKFWCDMVRLLSQNVGITFFSVSSSNVIPEVLLSMKLGWNFWFSSDTVAVSSIPVITAACSLIESAACLFVVLILLLFFSWLIKSDKNKKPRGHFFAFTNIPLSFFMPLSIEVATSNTVIIMSCVLS